MTIVHDFRESLGKSAAQANAPWWYEVYKLAFPSMAACVYVRKDGWAQRGGVDRMLTLESGRTISVDEKVREKDWNDIALERWSDEAKQKPGWIQKPLLCDYIAYAFIPSRRCYLFPTLLLQRAWRLSGREWIASYGQIRAYNKGYVTISIPVPIPVLLSALSNSIVVEWGNDG